MELTDVKTLTRALEISVCLPRRPYLYVSPRELSVYGSLSYIISEISQLCVVVYGVLSRTSDRACIRCCGSVCVFVGTARIPSPVSRQQCYYLCYRGYRYMLLLWPQAHPAHVIAKVFYGIAFSPWILAEPLHVISDTNPFFIRYV